MNAVECIVLFSENKRKADLALNDCVKLLPYKVCNKVNINMCFRVGMSCLNGCYYGNSIAEIIT